MKSNETAVRQSKIVSAPEGRWPLLEAYATILGKNTAWKFMPLDMQ